MCECKCKGKWKCKCKENRSPDRAATGLPAIALARFNQAAAGEGAVPRRNKSVTIRSRRMSMSTIMKKWEMPEK
jgi:hypothetical protein